MNTKSIFSAAVIAALAGVGSVYASEPVDAFATLAGAAAEPMTRSDMGDVVGADANMTMTIWAPNVEPIRPLGNPTGQDFRFTVEAGTGAPTFMECVPAGCAYGVVEPSEWRNPNRGVY